MGVVIKNKTKNQNQTDKKKKFHKQKESLTPISSSFL